MKKMISKLFLLSIVASFYSCGKSDPTKLLEKLEANLPAQAPKAGSGEGGTRPDPCEKSTAQIFVLYFDLQQLPIKGAMEEIYFQSTPQNQTLNGQSLDESIGWDFIVSWDEKSALMGLHDYQEKNEDQFFMISGKSIEIKSVTMLNEISAEIVKATIKKDPSLHVCQSNDLPTLLFDRDGDLLKVKWMQSVQVVAKSE